MHRNKNKSICVTGAGGLIGGYIVKKLCAEPERWNQIIPVTRNSVDLTDQSAVFKFLDQTHPDVIIHCAGMTSNPACEKDPESARRLNVDCCRWLREASPDAWICHFSTDLVFDGKAGNYNEFSPLSPVGIYAETKAESEDIILKDSGHCVVRTSLNGGVSATGDRGFNEKMRAGWVTGQPMPLFVDEFRNPIPASVTADTVVKLAALQPSGVFHVCGSEKLSRYQIGEIIARRWPGLNPQLVAGSIKDYTGPPRSPDCSMDCQKVQDLLSLPRHLPP